MNIIQYNGIIIVSVSHVLYPRKARTDTGAQVGDPGVHKTAEESSAGVEQEYMSDGVNDKKKVADEI